MTETIAVRLVGACKDIVPFYLSEAEADVFPYAVYEADYTPSYVKDGIYKIDGDVTVRVYSDSFSEADTIASSLRSEIISTMNADGFTTKEESSSKNCTEGVWAINLHYLITQR